MQKIILPTTVKSWGNSLGIRIPKKIIDNFHLHDGSPMKIMIDGNKIILEPDNNTFFNLSINVSLATVLSKITNKNKHSSSEFEDDPMGNEIW